MAGDLRYSTPPGFHVWAAKVNLGRVGRLLTPLRLSRVGLYWHVQEETLLGPSAPGTRQNALTYDLSLAKTWTSPASRLGNLSTFLETYARTDLDGSNAGRTVVSLTPGLRFNVHHHHVFMFGVELPVTHPEPYRQMLQG